jgi:hypothetical protein
MLILTPLEISHADEVKCTFFFRFFLRSSVPERLSRSVSSFLRFYCHPCLPIALPSFFEHYYTHQSRHHHADDVLHIRHLNHHPVLEDWGQTSH